MILPIPPIYGFSFVAVPVWHWEPGVQTGASAAPAPSCDGGETAPAPANDPPPPPPPRLVFRGYEWRPLASWYPIVNPAWDHWVDNDPDEIRDRAARQEQERHAQLRVTPASRAGKDIDR